VAPSSRTRTTGPRGVRLQFAVLIRCNTHFRHPPGRSPPAQYRHAPDRHHQPGALGLRLACMRSGRRTRVPPDRAESTPAG
jgi:hypothetical protein